LNRSTHFFRTCTVLLLCLALAAPPLSANREANFAWMAPAAVEFHGQVKFANMGIPGVTVTVTLQDKTYIAITDPQGIYTFKSLPDGAGSIKVEMLGFTPIQQDITINSQVPFNPTWELKLQAFDEIKAAAPPPAPATPKPAVSASATPETAPAVTAPTTKENLPAPPAAANSKGFKKADVNATGQQNAAAPAEPASDAPADDATKNNATEGFLVNGSVNNGAASPFAQSAAFGNNRRPGRSLYNGGLGIVIDNSVFDARNFSVNGQDVPKSAYSQITGNAIFGGPIKWPRNIRNPLQVTIAYAWTHNRQTPTSSGLLMPVDANRQGNFQGALTALGAPLTTYDPTTGLPFPNNTIPATRLSLQALGLVKYFPEPNFSGSSVYNFETPLVSIKHQDAPRINFNKTLTQKDSINGLWAMQSIRSDSTSAFGFLDTTDTLGMNSSINWMHRVSSRVFMTFGFSYSYLSTKLTPFFDNRNNVSGNLDIAGNDQSPLFWGPPTLTFTNGVSQLTDAIYSSNRNQTAAPSFQTFWNHNPHNIRFGGDFRRQEFNYLTQTNPRGSFTFTGAETGSLVNGVVQPGTGSAFADFMLGVPDISSIAYGNADKYLRSSWYDAYINDDWRFNSSLTFNLGLRWDYGAPITEKYNRLVNLDITPGYTQIAPVLSTDPVGSLTGMQYPTSLVNPDKHEVQPIMGLAWRPLPASSLVVRAGYSVRYNTSVYQTIASLMMQQSPLSKSANETNTAATPLTLANGFTTPSSAITNTFAIDPNFKIGYAQNWNASIQRDLPGALVMSIYYNGIKGTRAVQVFYPNTYPLGAVNPCLACPAGYAYMASNGDSTREAGTLQLRRRLHNGFTATLNYTYSKSIDDAVLGGRATGGSVVAQNWLNLAGERGLSPFDQRHLVNLQVQYSTGVGIGGGTLLDGWRGRLYKDWTITSNITVGSGLPETPSDPALAVANASGSVRPQYTGANLYAAPAGYYLNSAAYTTPPSGEWGDAGRDSIIGPSQFSLNASMQRDFRLNDRLTATLRFDSVNTLNHVSFSSYQTTITSGQFGLPAGSNPMRSLTTTFRLRF
jgi:hypothetical protein